MKIVKNTIYDKEQNSLESALKNGTSRSLLKATISLIPLVGDFVNELFPVIYRDLKNSFFLDFLNGFGQKINDENIKDNDINKLKKKIRNAESFQYLSTILDGVFFSKSSKSRMILGIICATYMLDSTLPYEDLIIVNALKDTLDCELESFVKIYENAKNNDASKNGGKGAFYFEYNPTDTSLNTSFFKFKNNNLIGTFENPSMLVGKLPEKIPGVITSISDKLYHYIKILQKR